LCWRVAEFFVTASIIRALSLGRQRTQSVDETPTYGDVPRQGTRQEQLQFYQADMNASALERLELESDLRHALEQGEFVLYYQPQFGGDGKRLGRCRSLAALAPSRDAD